MATVFLMVQSETTNPREPAGYAMEAATYMGPSLSTVTGSQPNQFDFRPPAMLKGPPLCISDLALAGIDHVKATWTSPAGGSERDEGSAEA